MKRIIGFILIVTILLVALVSCQEPTVPTPEQTQGETTGDTTPVQLPGQTPIVQENHYALTKDTDGVTVLGVRHESVADGILCDWSGVGIELTVNHLGGDIRFNLTASAPCMFRAYVDGNVWYFSESNPYCTVYQLGKIVLVDVPAGTHTIQIVKVTDISAQATITSVDFNGSITASTSESAKTYIEFVGDRMAAGMQLAGTSTAGAFATQDITLAYTGLLAENYGADYAMTVHADAALVAGNTNISAIYSDGYDFARKADVVVIDLGANDMLQNVSATEFGTAYQAFLQLVKEKNGADCRIVCVYGIAGDTYNDAIFTAVEALGGEESGIFCVSLSVFANGTIPTAQEHRLYEFLLKNTLDQLLDVESGGLSFVDQGDGDDDYIDFSQMAE